MMKKVSLRESILATSTPKPVPVTGIKGWNGVFVRHRLVGEVDGKSGHVTEELTTAYGLASVLCDESGELIFDAKNMDDLLALAKLEATIMKQVSKAMGQADANTDDEAEALGNG